MPSPLPRLHSYHQPHFASLRKDGSEATSTAASRNGGERAAEGCRRCAKALSGAKRPPPPPPQEEKSQLAPTPQISHARRGEFREHARVCDAPARPRPRPRPPRLPPPRACSPARTWWQLLSPLVAKLPETIPALAQRLAACGLLQHAAQSARRGIQRVLREARARGAAREVIFRPRGQDGRK